MFFVRIQNLFASSNQFLVLISFCFILTSVSATAAPTADFTVSATVPCVGQNVVFTNTSSGSITSYSWDFGSGASPVTASTVGPHTVSYSTAGLKTISLTVNGPDGSNTIVKTNFINVASSVPSPGSISGPSSVCANASGIVYSITTLANASTYTWTVPSGASVASGQGTNSATVNFGTSGGNICLTASNGCGISASVCKAITVGKDRIIIMSYNLLNYPDGGSLTADTSLRNPYYRTIVASVNPDIFVTQENTSSTSVTGILSYVLNPAIGGYAAATFINGYDSDNALFYKTSKFSFVSNTRIYTDLRDINEFKLVHLLSGDTLRIYSVHLKASATTSDENQRAQEVDSLRKVTNALPIGSNFLVCGDFNIYKASEPAYQKLILVTPGVEGQFVDPVVMTTTWNSLSNADKHTQSTRTRAFGGGSTGGLDDRFDFILYSNAISQSGGVTYVPNSTYPLGNDGNHYDDSINAQPNTAVSIDLANALHYAADHLPVVASFDFENTSCPVADLGVTSLLVPGDNICSASSQSLQVQVKNYGTNQVNFSFNNMQVTLQATLPSSTVQNFVATVNSGVLNAGATMTVSFPSTLDMSSSGTYTFSSQTNFSGDTIPSNNAMPVKQVQVYANTPSTISASGPLSFCAGGSVLLSSNQTNGVSYQWKLNSTDISGAIGSTFTASQNGNYQVLLQKINSITTNYAAASFSNNNAFSIPNNSCTGATSTITVSGYNGPVSSPAISVKINITHTYVGDLAIFLEAPDGSRLGLSNRTGSNSNSGDNYTNTIFSDNGSVQIPTTGAPYTGTYKAWTSIFTSCISSTITTFAAIGGGSFNPNGNWKLIVFDRSASNTGSIVNWQLNLPAYSVASSLVCDPVLSAASVVTVNPLPLITYTPSVPVICSSSGLTMTASGASTYSWSPSTALNTTTGSTVTTSTVVPITYTVTGTNTSGCSSSATINITINTPPTVTLGSFNPVCVNTPSFSLSGGSPSGGTYSGPGIASNIFSPTSAGAGLHTITYTYTDGNGCQASSSSTIQVNNLPPVSVSPAGPLLVCQGSSVTLSATAGYNYLWSTNATTSSVSVSSAGNYTVRLTDANGCSATSSAVVITQSTSVMTTANFAESMGIVSGTTSIASHQSAGGFDNTNLTMSGSADIRATTVSTGYTGASGVANIFITNIVGRNFIIAGINSVGLTNPQLTFGIYKSTTASNGSELKVQYSTNGSTWTDLVYPVLNTGSGTASWTSRTVSSGIPSSPTLSIQFIQTSAAGVQFRIDDVMLTYDNPNPSISATGTTNLCQGSSVILKAVRAPSYAWSQGATTQSVAINTSSALYCTLTGFNGCVASSNVIQVTAKPGFYNVNGGGNICSGSTGVLVGLSGSETGVNYQLKRNTVNVGTALSGTGSAISFGLQTIAGNYTVQATEVSSSCIAMMNGSADVIVNPLPNIYIVSGGGAVCPGSSGLPVTLSNSQTGVNYQLRLNGSSSIGNPLSGNGSSLSFGNQLTSGTYTVIATNSSTGCTVTMSSQAVISLASAPTVFQMNGGGSYCVGGTGVLVGLNGSQSGIHYLLYNGSTFTGLDLTGNGNSLSFGNLTGPSTYSVVATNTSSGCTSNMNGTAVVTALARPLIQNVTGGGSYCAFNENGVPVILSNSESTVSYQLFISGNTPVGSALTGTGSILSFGNQLTAGVYTVIGTKISSGCTTNMNGNVTVIRFESSLWYADYDVDGFGDPNTIIENCIQPPGYISDKTDCNDNNPEVNPGMIEICGNGIDDNCNGQIDEACDISLQLHLFIEGFYRGSGMMIPSINANSFPTICDTIVVELTASTSPFAIVYSSSVSLQTNGIASLTIPIGMSGGNYYIVIRHRNALKAWSSQSVTLSPPLIDYNFTLSNSMTFGNNVHATSDGYFAFYSGDVNQDGMIDSLDMDAVENATQSFLVGYRAEDLTGDHLVEAADYSLIENNVAAGRIVIYP